MSFFRQLFSMLFGKQESAAEAPVAVQEEPVAPGTNIRFHPELIAKLTNDHQVLLSLFGETSEAAAQGDAAAAAEQLEAFRTALQGHLLTENIRLYVYLEHLFADDPSTYALIHEFRHEMDGIGKAVIRFLLKYEDLARHPEQIAAFASDLAAVGKVLVSRIEREEGTLYPLYTA
ncbi:MAG: hemerythrin domain-containing protein [Desulfobulbus sp.]|nr:hemerythrin domain-containing protein [Desulfobulbus sp.]